MDGDFVFIDPEGVEVDFFGGDFVLDIFRFLGIWGGVSSEGEGAGGDEDHVFSSHFLADVVGSPLVEDLDTFFDIGGDGVVFFFFIFIDEVDDK